MSVQEASETKAAGTQEEGGAYPWYVVGVLILLLLFSYLDRQIIILLIDPIRHDLGITDVQVSLLTGPAFAICFAICGLPLGWVADKFSRRWLIFWGVTFWGLATAACGLARTFGTLFIGRCAVGAGEASLIPAAYSTVSDTFPPRKLAFASSVLAIGSPLGVGLSFMIGGLIVSIATQSGTVILPIVGEVKAWQAVFLAVGLPGPFLALLIFTIREPERRASITATGAPEATDIMAFVREHKGYLGNYIPGYVALAMGVYAVQTWAPIYLSRVFGWSSAQVGFAFGPIIATSIILALLGGGAVVDYFYRRGMTDAHIRLYAIASLICIPIVILSVAAGHPLVFLAALFVWQALISGFSPAGTAAINIISPSRFRARFQALFLFCSTLIGYSFGSLFVAMLSQYVFKDDKMVGWSLVITICIIYPIAAFFFFRASKEMRKIYEKRGL